MRLARIQTPAGVVSGRYEADTVIAADGEYEIGRDGSLLPPCSPSAIYCVGRNYAETLDQMDYERPDQPAFFIKPPASLLAPGAEIRYPEWADELTYAGELAAVIDERCRDVEPVDVADVVRGYTIMNDLDAINEPGRTARKAFDGSAPLGPWIETDVDPEGMAMRTTISGDLRQESTTDLMLFDPADVIAFLSRRFTFRPGDVVAFGSPANPGTIEPGDDIEIEYEGVGTLTNSVIDGHLS